MNLNKLQLPRPQVLIFLLFLLLAFIVYSRVLGYGFLEWDDLKHTCENPSLFPPESASLLDLWTKPYFDMYIPVSYSVWWLLFQIGRIFGAGRECQDFASLFHGFNLVLQAINAFLIFKFFSLVPNQNKSQGPLLQRTACLVGGLFFFLHPLQVETVAWVSGMRDLLSVTCLLSALLVYFRNSPRGYGLASFLFVLAVLAKPTVVVAPVLFILFDVLLWQNSFKRSCLRFLPWAAAGVVLAVLTSHLQTNEASLHADLLQRTELFFFSLGFDLIKTAWPFPLAVDYAFPITRLLTASWLLPVAAVAAGFCGVVIFALFRTRSKIPIAAAAIFLAAILPVSGWLDFSFQRTSQVADRFNYLPLMGVALAIAWSFDKFPKIRLLWTVPLLLFAVLSFQQSSVWESDLTLFEHSVQVEPSGSTSQGNYGQALYEQGRLAEAEPHLRESLKLDPQNLEAAVTLGRTLEKHRGRSEAVHFYEDLIHSGREWAPVYNNLASLLYIEGNKSLATQYYRKAVLLKPDYFDSRLNLATSLLEAGDLDGAEASLAAAQKLRPNDPILQQALTDLQARRLNGK